MSLDSDLKALKKLSRVQRGAEDWTQLFQALNNDSDISTALVCSTFLEEATEQLLIAHMVPLNSDDHNELFRGLGPMSSLSARTKCAYALGLIGKVTKHNLDLLREIRNAIAHSKKPLGFDTPEVKAVCRRLKLTQQVPNNPPEILATMEQSINRPKYRFITLSLGSI